MSPRDSSSEQTTEQDSLAGAEFERFVQRIAYLRGPDGCPWDRAQTHESITKNMIEEAHEAVDAIENGTKQDVIEELGDVLLQVVLQSQIAEDAGEFTITDVIEGVDAKMVRRHPHVFGEGAQAQDAAAALARWESVKLSEKAAKSDADSGLLAGIPRALPALAQAQNISKKAVSAGFEWETTEDVWAQVDEEVEEFHETEFKSPEAVEEFGDILFTLVNVARKEKIDAETALRLACDKFRNRWAIMEQCAQEQGKRIDEFSVEEQEAFWATAKARLKKD